jgi:hypothetical protein
MRRRVDGTLPSLDRRDFLAGASALAGLKLLSTSAYGGQSVHTIVGTVGTRPAPQRAVFQQMPYFSFDGTGEAYERPAASAATREYLNGLGREEYLRLNY